MAMATIERGCRATGRPRGETGPAPLELYLHDISAAQLLTAAQEKELALRIQDGDSAARDAMVRANLRLVVSIARASVGRGLDLQDLIAEGNLGLLRAVEGFDPYMNTRFSTYAAYWIRQSIRRSLQNTARTIRLPSYMLGLLTKWRRASAELQEQLNRTPTTEEIARRLKLSRRKLKVLTKAIRIYQASPQAELGEPAEPGTQLLDLLADERVKAPNTTLLEKSELSRVLKLLEKLEPREADVLRRRFGVQGREPQTLKLIGVELGLTRERVRQIEIGALHKLAEQLGAE